MKTFIAMLRGVNVAGNMIAMARLRELLAACGFEDVRTYIQSGNAVFRARGSASAVTTAIERALQREMGKPVAVVVRTPQDLETIVAGNPFAKERGIEMARISISFLVAVPSKEALTALAAVKSGRDRFKYSGKALYLYCPDGFGTSKLAAAHERVLRITTTVRNWNTVSKLLEMATIQRSNSG